MLHIYIFTLRWGSISVCFSIVRGTLFGTLTFNVTASILGAFTQARNIRYEAVSIVNIQKLQDLSAISSTT